MTYLRSLVTVAILATLYKVTYAVDCYECNVYQGGNGYQCPEDFRERAIIQRRQGGAVEDITEDTPIDRWLGEVPIKRGCEACMKFYTKVEQNHRKYEFTTATVVSRVCAGKEIHLTKYDLNSCKKMDAIGGVSVRCFCQTDKCNGATKLGITFSLVLSLSLFVFKRLFL
ncbi:uncharacterized protein LOC106172013 [Lingula anatina]|uniref:Uncharacterized protein LOC106172013 n=1 Tax=Lingula anatina TaxID=7574 RepID=A0A1S3JCB6_LINAN|nr:uncharacterized protein LOC106172013 [Lingula anatina]|eukprot:XP_013408042.1 uncharacterized protein LOC106172013 [Lingula anatina]